MKREEKRIWKEKRIVTRDSHNLGKKKYYEEWEREMNVFDGEEKRMRYEWKRKEANLCLHQVTFLLLFLSTWTTAWLAFQGLHDFYLFFHSNSHSNEIFEKDLKFLKKEIAANQQLVFLSSFLLEFFLSWTLPDLKKTATWLFNSFLMTCGWIFSQLKSWSAFIQSLHRSINISLMQQVTLPDLYASTLKSFVARFLFLSLLLFFFFFLIEDFSFLWTGFDHYHHHPWVRAELRKGST